MKHAIRISANSIIRRALKDNRINGLSDLEHVAHPADCVNELCS